MFLNFRRTSQPTTGYRSKWQLSVQEAADGMLLMSHICRNGPSQVTSGNKKDSTPCSCGQSWKQHHMGDKSEVQHADMLEHEQNVFVKMALNDCGTMPGNIQFIRCSPYWSKTYEALEYLICKDVDECPQLIVSCLGGANYFTMSDDLEKEFINAMGQIAATDKVWLLTTGMNSGVSKLIGQAIRRHKLLHDNSSNATLIGMISWDVLTNSAQQYIQEGKVKVNNMMERAFKREYDFSSEEDQSKVPDVNHTHWLLLDMNKPNYYLDDEPRSRFVETVCKKRERERKCHAVTIIVDGGRYTLDVILNDLRAKRPVVIIHGSGRIASLLGMLLQPTGDKTEDEFDSISDKIKDHLRLFPTLGPDYVSNWNGMIADIQKVLDQEYLPYLKVFDLRRDTNLTATIFQAVFDAEHNMDISITNGPDPLPLLELAVSWKCVDKAHQILELREDSEDYFPKLFKQALKEQQAAFVDYFLRRYYDPLRTNTKNNTEGRQPGEDMLEKKNKIGSVGGPFELIQELYQHIIGSATTKLLVYPDSLRTLDRTYKVFIGPYVTSFYYKESTFQRLAGDIRRLLNIASASQANYEYSQQYNTQSMLRDLFLWSIFAGYDDIAFVLLLNIKERIGAALLATAIAKRLSFVTDHLDVRAKFGKQADAYATYAAECIKLCHGYDERSTCKILLLPRSSYGDITYMQVSIASHIAEFAITDSFDKVLTEQWNGYLDNSLDGSLKSKCAVIFSLLTFGLLAPFLCEYCPEKEFNKKHKKDQINEDTQRNSTSERAKNQHQNQPEKKVYYWNQVAKFHSTPAIKMLYHYLIYILFLLTFSYMMMFHMKSSQDRFHWTQIYVIITVSTMVIEGLRQFIVEYSNHMMERWHSDNLWKIALNIVPYLLFYIGIGLYYRADDDTFLFSAARIVLALDLGVYYLFSLRFLSAFEFFGPKLVMIRKMMGDLLGFLYIIFVCAAAYGVVSCSLTMYNTIEFTAQNVTSIIFYRTYWFLYGSVDNEKSNLDDIIWSNSSTEGQVAEATVNHIILATHMIFINILILSLLIAVFGSTIEAITSDSKFIWNYVRYKMVREYHEKSLFAHPPLSVLAYLGLLIKMIFGWKPIFPMLKSGVTKTKANSLIDFEHEATYSYARERVEKEYRQQLQSKQLLEKLEKTKTIISSSRRASAFSQTLNDVKSSDGEDKSNLTRQTSLSPNIHRSRH